MFPCSVGLAPFPKDRASFITILISIMTAKKNYLLSFITLLIICSGTKNSFATHISKPILIDPKTHYTVGNPVALHGWVEYNAQPAPDVLN
jgi:hypothetical protein